MAFIYEKLPSPLSSSLLISLRLLFNIFPLLPKSLTLLISYVNYNLLPQCRATASIKKPVDVVRVGRIFPIEQHQAFHTSLQLKFLPAAQQ
jgi:hypothetical protein